MPYPILDPTGTTATAPPGSPRRRAAGTCAAPPSACWSTPSRTPPRSWTRSAGSSSQQHGATGTMARTKVNFAAPAPDDLVKEMATGCDVIVTGIGDCGSCSASAVADGIAFEAAGLPAAAICSDAFRSPPTRWPNSAAPPATATRPRPTRWRCSPPTR